MTKQSRKDLLKLLWKRQDGECIYCDKQFDYNVQARRPTFDHIIPGAWGEFNLVLACEACNGAKSDFVLWSFSVQGVPSRIIQREELIYRTLLLQLNVLRRMRGVFYDE
jgi:hypothetical protein